MEKHSGKKINFHFGDITDPSTMDTLFGLYNGDVLSSDPDFKKIPPIQVDIHFAASKAVGESITIPLK